MKHPGIVRPVCTFGSTIIAPFIEGLHVNQYVALLPYTKAGEEKLISLLAQILAIVFHVHSQGYQLQDLGESNFMVTNYDNRVKYVAGSKSVESYRDEPVPSHLSYLNTAPEQLAGNWSPKMVSADMWKYGKLAAEMISIYFARGASRKKEWRRGRAMRGLNLFQKMTKTSIEGDHFTNVMFWAIPPKYIVFLRPFFESDGRMRFFMTATARRRLLTRSIFAATRWDTLRFDHSVPRYTEAVWYTKDKYPTDVQRGQDGKTVLAIPTIFWDSVLQFGLSEWLEEGVYDMVQPCWHLFQTQS